MMKRAIVGANARLGAPEDWNAQRDGPCDVLPVRISAVGGVGTLESAWEPTETELKLLNAGASVVLRVYGQNHPPVSLYVDPATVPERQSPPPPPELRWVCEQLAEKLWNFLRQDRSAPGGKLDWQSVVNMAGAGHSIASSQAVLMRGMAATAIAELANAGVLHAHPPTPEAAAGAGSPGVTAGDPRSPKAADGRPIYILVRTRDFATAATVVPKMLHPRLGYVSVDRNGIAIEGAPISMSEGEAVAALRAAARFYIGMPFPGHIDLSDEVL